MTMKFTVSTILIALLSSLTEFFLPWWTIAIVAFIVSLVFRIKPGLAFLSGFLGIVFFWLPDILFKDFSNNHILSHRMAKLFGLPNSMLFILVSVLVGSLVGGLAALSGSLMAKQEKKRKSLYWS